MGAIHQFELNLTALGHGSRVVIDGVDFADKLSRIVVDSRAGELTKIYLEVNAIGGVLVEGEGAVFERPSSDELRLFLENVDPVALEQATMARLEGLDGGGTPLEAALDVLKEWSRGDDNRT